MALGGLLEIREICLHVSRNSRRFVTQVISTTAAAVSSIVEVTSSEPLVLDYSEDDSALDSEDSSVEDNNSDLAVDWDDLYL